MPDSVLLPLGIALAIGLVVGLERGWRLRDEPAGSRVAGLRTYGITGLLGGTTAATADAVGSPAVLAAGMVAFAVVFALFQLRDADRRGSVSVTATIAGMAVFALGAMAVVGDQVAASAAGVALAGILASRELLHRLLQKLTWPEVRSALLLLAMSAIVLPVLPNRALDPWGGFNPFEIWLFTVLVATISFAGYVATRVIGPGRGILAAGLIGAVVSSTAVTASFARRARKETPVSLFAGGAALAAMVSILRVTTVVFLVQPSLLPAFALPALGAAAVFGLGGGLLFRRAGLTGTVETDLGNPFDIVPVLIFAGTFAALSLASAAAAFYFGPDSILIASGISGLADVDVATLSAARLSAEAIPLPTAARAILIALAANGLGRILISAVAGPPAYWGTLAAVTATAFGVGAILAIVLGPF